MMRIPVKNPEYYINKWEYDFCISCPNTAALPLLILPFRTSTCFYLISVSSTFNSPNSSKRIKLSRNNENMARSLAADIIWREVLAIFPIVFKYLRHYFGMFRAPGISGLLFGSPHFYSIHRDIVKMAHIYIPDEEAL